MNRPPADHPPIRLDTGVGVLDAWSVDATDTEKKTVYRALFAMTDQSMLRRYRVIDDRHELSEFFVLLEDDLVLKLRVHSFDSFGIVYVGPHEGAPGLKGHRGTGLAA